ncbi:hypothetical protein [Microbacterium sp.]|uniref:hypothetical protein n=1 Tax=Microbacterium sp. TaxID=51671 RepID=UPI002810B435|nr:hypothetical protein [Microbacterium sp.]
MTLSTDRLIEGIVATTVAERPVPANYEDLDDKHRALIERQAASARMTPSALWALSRTRANLSQGERYKARIADERNLREGRAMDDEGTVQSGYNLDAIVEGSR